MPSLAFDRSGREFARAPVVLPRASRARVMVTSNVCSRPGFASRRRSARVAARIDDDDGSRQKHRMFISNEPFVFDASSRAHFIAHATDATKLETVVSAAEADAASEALKAAMKLPTREVTKRVFSDRGTAEQFKPNDLIERFVADVDETYGEKVSQIKSVKCASCKVGYSDVVLLQAFDWLSTRRSHDSAKSYYDRILDRVDFIADYGVTHVWLPPPSLSVSPEGYMPSELYNLNASEYGNEASLKALIGALKKKGIIAIADVVINHRCAEYTSDGHFKSFADEQTPSGRKINWGKWAIAEDDPRFEGTGNVDSGDSIGIAPDLDHANPEIRDALVEWLTWLKDEIGFGGWRFDFVQGYAPEYAREYVERTVGFQTFSCAENWVGMKWTNDVLEYNQDAPRRVLMDWLAAANDAAALFDFPTKGILQEAIKRREFWRLKDARGEPPGLAGFAPQLSVLFVDNHDTGYPQMHWPFPTDRLGCGYAYTLLHPGIPSIFGPHIWCSDASPAVCWNSELPHEIKTLLKIRKSAGICCESKVKILAATNDLYVANIDDKLIVKLGPQYEMPAELLPNPDEFSLETSGDDYAVWMRRQ